MIQSSDRRIDQLFSTPIGRRTLLALGARGAMSLCTALGAGAALSLFGSMTGCYRAPGTARDQVIFFSEEKELETGASAFREVLRAAPLSDSVEVNELVHRVGRKIAEAANKPEYQWEFAVIQDDKMVNAFALPGGKVAIFTGILKHTKDDAGLATVIGHEVAHALQRHGVERMSRSIIDQIVQVGAMAAAASGAVGRTDPRNTGIPGGTGGMSGAALQGLLAAYGVNVSLPFNRKQESEADEIGLLLMAKAGYDPREAVPFWERMSGCPKQMIEKLCFRSQQAVPEFLSTHPSDLTRINQIEAWLPKALQHYHGPGGGTAPPPGP